MRHIDPILSKAAICLTLALVLTGCQSHQPLHECSEKLSSQTDIAFVNSRVVELAHTDWESVLSCYEIAPRYSLDTAVELLGIVRLYEYMAETDEQSESLSQLASSILSFINFLGGREGLSNHRIANDLGGLQSRAYRLMVMATIDPGWDSRSTEAERVRLDLLDFLDRIGVTAKNFHKPIEDVYQYLGNVPRASTGAEVRTSNAKIQDRLNCLASQTFDLERSLNEGACGYANEVLRGIQQIGTELLALPVEENFTEYQQSFFQDQLNHLRDWSLRLFQQWNECSD